MILTLVTGKSGVKVITCSSFCLYVFNNIYIYIYIYIYEEGDHCILPRFNSDTLKSIDARRILPLRKM